MDLGLERYNEINAFVDKAFNYFNGRINIFHKAKLKIEWVNLYITNIGGKTVYPNIIYVYPNAVARYSRNDYELYLNLLLVIAHELYHIDQLYYTSKYITDNKYKQVIENNAEFYARQYICSHINEINNYFGINLVLNPNAINAYLMQYADGNIYNRKRSLKEHLYILLDDIMRGDNKYTEYINIIDTFFNNDNSNISVSVNNQNFTIKDGIRLCDIYNFDEYFYNVYFIYNIRINTFVNLIYNDDNNICINIRFSGMHSLCKSLKK